MLSIRVADFSIFPGGRFRRDSAFSGEEYREDVLAPALLEAIQDRDTLFVELAGTKGYGSSFLDEAFGGLVRHGIVSRRDCDRHLKVTASEELYEPYRRLVTQYIAAADLAVA